MEYVLIFIMLAAMGIFGLYFYTDYKRKEYMQDYHVSIIEAEELEKKSKAELDAHVRMEQEKKSFYMDVILTHGNALGVKSAIDNEGRRRKGILPIGEITMIGKNNQGEDSFYHIDEAGMELWATFEEDEMTLKSKESAFEIRTEGTPRDKGTKTYKATIKEGQKYYIILDSRHEIGLLAQRN